MKRHLAYLKYVIRHKWFVLFAGLPLRVPFWRLLVHDMSKFRPSEWFAYAATFYKSDGSKQYDETPKFNRAWLLHQHRNPHHWQYWLLREDSPKTRFTICDMGDWEGGTHIHDKEWASADAGVPSMDLRADRPEVDKMMRNLVRLANREAGLIAIEMPRKYALEMVADWMGAGRAITGKWECAEWYAKNREKIVLHKRTRELVDNLLT